MTLVRTVIVADCPACTHPYSSRTPEALRDAIAEHEGYAHREAAGHLIWTVSQDEYHERETPAARGGRE
ncbi:MAG TPA: hypothetical protein VEA16_16895 [Vicinamibacterales bacterium]|nr:hypothetical protein [Vicinamibacterales bacterium]